MFPRFSLLCLSLCAMFVMASEFEQQPAPSFKLSDQYGDIHELGDFSGQWLVVFFYPRADTPGCTTEACNFRDNIYAIRGIGAEVVGISTDPVDRQREFSDKYRLPFAILSDSDGAASRSFGVLREVGDNLIARRESFLINPEGVIVKHYSSVNPDTHTQEVVADLQQLASF